MHTHDEALGFILKWVAAQQGADPVAAGHRVVHGGEAFAAPVRVDAAVLAKLEELVPLAPLHQPHNLAAIRAMAALRPGLPQVACFDTAFHRTQPRLAQIFALPRELTGQGIKRYGFHGLSYEYISGALAGYMGDGARGRVIVAHLGNGASLCALRDGISVATTMGFSTLDGLVMGTRGGNLDPGVLVYLLRQGWDVARIENLLYRESGLLGVSGMSSDMRDLLASADAHAQEAVALFAYRIMREIGSLAAALGGLDALVFTGGIGERAAPVRSAVCEQLAWLGVALDTAANDKAGPCITQPQSKVSAWVIPTDEELVIVRHTLAAVST
jgi:acetate kinase